tara:strand:- start:296 stop:715 length:420 start_codon:yes stop_codon:yes gene_type:complete
MKHIRKFNESIDVVDPMMDALDFREKFSGQITKNSRLDHELREIENNSTNQTEDYNIYEVYETDEDVRRKVIIFGYFKAISHEHSKIKAAMFINKFGIAVSGYYKSSLLTSNDIKDAINDYYDQIEDIKKTINLIKNPI